MDKSLLVSFLCVGTLGTIDFEGPVQVVLCAIQSASLNEPLIRCKNDVK